MRLLRAVLTAFLVSACTTALGQAFDVNKVISGIGNSDFKDGVRRIDNTSDVRIVRLSSLAGAAQAAEGLAEALAAKPRDIAYLRSSVVLNPSALWALRNAGFELD